MMVGAVEEKSGSPGVDGAPGDTSVEGAGATCVFDSAVWTDLDGGTQGMVGEPDLFVPGPLTAGSALHVTLSQAPAGALLGGTAPSTSRSLSWLGGALHADPFELTLSNARTATTPRRPGSAASTAR